MHCNCVSIPDKNHDLQKLHHVHHLSSKPIMKVVKAYFHLGITGRQKYSINKQYFFKVLCKCLQRQINILINDNTHPQLALTVTETFSGALYTRLTDETISYIIINKKKNLRRTPNNDLNITEMFLWSGSILQWHTDMKNADDPSRNRKEIYTWIPNTFSKHWLKINHYFSCCFSSAILVLFAFLFCYYFLSLVNTIKFKI